MLETAPTKNARWISFFLLSIADAPKASLGKVREVSKQKTKCYRCELIANNKFQLVALACARHAVNYHFK